VLEHQKNAYTMSMKLAINHLTINEENSLKRKIEVPKFEKSRIDMPEAKNQKLERKHR
jgi:hypothetical protein